MWRWLPDYSLPPSVQLDSYFLPLTLGPLAEVVHSQESTLPISYLTALWRYFSYELSEIMNL